MRHTHREWEVLCRRIGAIEEDSLTFCHAFEARLAALEARCGIKAGYRPDQPRVPRGQPGGGQWTDDPAYPDAIEEVPLEILFGVLGLGRALFGRMVGRGAAQWTFGSYKSPQRWANQMKERGWEIEDISQALLRGKRFKAPQ